MPERIYLNGQFLPEREAGLSLTDAGFTWGATVVDNCRTYRGKLFRWADHLKRFRHDCDYCQVPLLLSDQELTRVAESMVHHNRHGDEELQLVTFATPGDLSLPTFGMRTYPVPEAKYQMMRDNGVSLVETGTSGMAFVSPRIKHRSRMAWWIAEQKIQKESPSFIPVFFDHARQTYTETAIANLLIVRDGEIISPPAELILDGISLRVVKELCRELAIPFREQTIATFDCDETFLAGTGIGLARVARFEGRKLTANMPLLEMLSKRWRNRFETSSS